MHKYNKGLRFILTERNQSPKRVLSNLLLILGSGKDQLKFWFSRSRLLSLSVNVSLEPRTHRAIVYISLPGGSSAHVWLSGPLPSTTNTKCNKPLNRRVTLSIIQALLQSFASKIG